MAAGIGSRFGEGIKQLTKLGPNGEIIIDYSIHDAIKAGFNEVVFIIRKDIEKDFKEVIGDRISKIIPVKYAYQAIDDLPAGFHVPEGRKKPWGTGQAVLCAKSQLDCPFAVINADDYYGQEGFRKVHDYLVNSDGKRDGKLDLCMAGYILGNTLSENGAVTRGICELDQKGDLKSVRETFDIMRRDGKITGKDAEGREVELREDDLASMNMWGLTPQFLDEVEKGFPEFLKQAGDNIKAEYLLPECIGKLLRDGIAVVKVLHTDDQWFGVTYAEDKEYVQKALRDLRDRGVYGDQLFG